MVQNINSYYSSFVNWHTAIADQVSSTRDYLIQTGTYLRDSGKIVDTFTDQIKENNSNIVLIERNIVAAQKQLQEGLSSGNIVEDSEEFRDLNT